MAGNDTLDGRGGPDEIVGGNDNDTIRGDLNPTGGKSGDHGNDQLYGNDGNDTVFGEGGVDTLEGGNNNDTMDGGPDGDNVVGGDGDDTLHGGDGNDDVNGGTGTDGIFGDNNDDYLRAKDGIADTVNGGAGADTAELDRSCFGFFCNDVDSNAEVETKLYP